MQWAASRPFVASAGMHEVGDKKFHGYPMISKSVRTGLHSINGAEQPETLAVMQGARDHSLRQPECKR